jgi:predicted DNA-binding transcriptional regulator AlpA
MKPHRSDDTTSAQPDPLNGRAGACLQMPGRETSTQPGPPTAVQFTPLLVDIQGLAVLLSRSVPALERDQAAGRIPRPLRIGRSKRWPLAEIQDWIAAGCPCRREWEVRRR